jgi:ribosomal protein S18 acetylase RimI-like enzyme
MAPDPVFFVHSMSFRLNSRARSLSPAHTSQTMIIRAATSSDLERIYQITEQSFGPYCAAQAIYERYGIGRGVEDKARSVRRFCEADLGQVIVAEENGVVAGYYSYSLHDEHGMLQLSANAVDPASQGRGIGTALARHVVRELLENQGKENIFVATLAHDKPARRVYEKVGFTEVYRQFALSSWKERLEAIRPDSQIPGIEIRGAMESDRERLVEIARIDAVAHAYPARLMEERFGVRAGRSWQQRCASEIGRLLGTEELFVAQCDEGIAGYTAVACPKDSEFGRIGYPIVDPELRYPRLRDLLFDFVLKEARAAEWTRVVDVAIDADDQDALESCKAAAFEEFSCGIGFAMRRDEAVFS